jgi:lipopolysaccharide transport protein LptA
LNVDYANNVTVLDGDVLVVDPRITVRADKVVVYSANKSAGTNTTGAASNTLATATSGTSRTIQRIVADGSVVITIDDKKSTSDHAEYFAEEGKVILTGNPHVQSPDGSVAGKQITFWRGSQKMDVVADETATNRTRLVIYPEDQRKKKDGE